MDIKCCTCYFDGMTNRKSPDPNKIKIRWKTIQNILIYQTGYVTVKYHAKIKTVNNLYLSFDKRNDSIGESSGNKYLALASNIGCKNILKNMKKYGVKSKILLDQYIMTQTTIVRNIWKINLIWMMNCL